MRPGVEEFLREKSIAVVGVSRTKGFGNDVMHALRDAGYQVFPVNAAADTVEGERCWHHLAELPQKPGGVVAVVPPNETEHVVDECAQLGIQKLWMQLGAASDAAIARAQAAGITTVHHACVIEYAKPHGIHKVHQVVDRVIGRL